MSAADRDKEADIFVRDGGLCSASSDDDSIHPDEAAEPALPTGFERYRIMKKLGQGGMGAVYLAQDTRLHRRVALKVPRLREGSGPEQLERFHREARATANVHHPNLCPLFDVGECNGVPYLTMAYIEGWPLTYFVRRDKRLRQSGVASLVRSIALGIAEAHKAGIIHRDLKPGNVIIDKRGQPIVMDFGLARWHAADEEDARLSKSCCQGVPVYMSPEQIEGDVEKMGPSCDIYSLGVILYELLTGRVPFEGSTTGVLTKALMQAPAPPSKHRTDLDSRLEAICLKAMAKDALDRFASMTDMAAALADYLRAEQLERVDDGGSSIILGGARRLTPDERVDDPPTDPPSARETVAEISTERVFAKPKPRPVARGTAPEAETSIPARKAGMLAFLLTPFQAIGNLFRHKR